jgi:hypothetical protein
MVSIRGPGKSFWRTSSDRPMAINLFNCERLLLLRRNRWHKTETDQRSDSCMSKTKVIKNQRTASQKRGSLGRAARWALLGTKAVYRSGPQWPPMRPPLTLLITKTKGTIMAIAIPKHLMTSRYASIVECSTSWRITVPWARLRPCISE